ncbi:hypothetical protein ACFLR0_01575 [Candidatus Bipolaricaulota bacterium]
MLTGKGAVEAVIDWPHKRVGFRLPIDLDAEYPRADPNPAP